jgi:hypothetical protein
MEMNDIRDPIIIDPPDLEPKDVWDDCARYVKRVGGMVYPDGEVNLAAAAGADPGCCSCPSCGQYFWMMGRIILCSDCGFQFNSDWWPMYSYGCSDAKAIAGDRKFPDPAFAKRLIAGIQERMPKRIQNPYYRYGLEHPVDDPWAHHDKLPWREIMKDEQS